MIGILKYLIVGKPHWLHGKTMQEIEALYAGGTLTLGDVLYLTKQQEWMNHVAKQQARRA